MAEGKCNSNLDPKDLSKSAGSKIGAPCAAGQTKPVPKGMSRRTSRR